MVVNHNDNDVVKLSILSLRKWQVDSHSSRAHWSSTKAWWLDVMTKCLDRVQLSTPCLKQHSTSLPQSTQRTSKSQRSMRCCASSANNAGHLLTKAGCGYDKTCTCYALLPQTSSEFHSWKRWSFKIWLSLLVGGWTAIPTILPCQDTQISWTRRSERASSTESSPGRERKRRRFGKFTRGTCCNYRKLLVRRSIPLVSVNTTMPMETQKGSTTKQRIRRWR